MPKDDKEKGEVKYNYFHWGPFLMHTNVPKKECQIFLDEGKRCRKNKKLDFRHKLAGHIKEEYALDNPIKLAPVLQKYFEAYTIGYNQWRGAGSIQPNFKLTALWINYMKANEFNPPHDHSGDLSFVLYPSVPQDIINECKAFTGTMRGPGGIAWFYGEGNRQCISAVNQLPESGDLYIFPATLKHWVFPFKSKVERVSVSGNVLFDVDSRMNYVGDPARDVKHK
tara:strand:- start:821 stop:1495 length:675 start_codon:yes stop_codon:yes gene_type:complete